MTGRNGQCRGPITGDAYGRLLCDYHERESGVEVVERDDGYLSTNGSAARYFRAPEEWQAQIRTALDSVHGRVLDVGCGAGQHALALQDRGHEVVGIDVSPGAVAVAKERGVTDVRPLGIEQLDRLAADSFDTVLLLGNNFGLVGNADRAPAILSELERITRADGIIIAESRDPHTTESAAHLAYHEWNREHGYHPGRIRLRIRYERYATEWFEYLLVSPAEMREVLRPTAWGVEERFVDEEGDTQYVVRLTKASERVDGLAE